MGAWGGVSNPFSAGRDSSGPQRSPRSRRPPVVSNPFSAGRDSSGQLKLALTSLQSSFKPLQRGAGFLCRYAGQQHGYADRFQTPSARGGIPLPIRRSATRLRRPVSNPFSAGRDSSAGGLINASGDSYVFQTPSARGGIPLDLHQLQAPRLRQVSNPFSAGRDSSGPWPLSSWSFHLACFKPLQRGAGFLCGTQFSPSHAAPSGFKPLQRGAGFLCLRHPGLQKQ